MVASETDMRILMTGATGLIGREVGKSLAARGDTLVCLVRNPQGSGSRLPFPATCFEWDHQRAVPAEASAFPTTRAWPASPGTT